jgi:hypothetical protein
VRAFGGRRPCDLDARERAEARARVAAAIKGVYRAQWSLPARARLLGGGANVVLPSEADVREPPCFREEPDLVPWRALVRREAMLAAAEYQLALAGAGGPAGLLGRSARRSWVEGRDADAEAAFEQEAAAAAAPGNNQSAEPAPGAGYDSDDSRPPGLAAEQDEAAEEDEPAEGAQCTFRGVLELGGGLAVLALSSLTRVRVEGARASADDPMLGAWDWHQLERCVMGQHCRDQRCLLVVLDSPLIDDSPADARSRACDPAAAARSWGSWLDLLAAWKAERAGRDVCVVSPAGAGVASSFTTAIERTAREAAGHGPAAAAGPGSSPNNVVLRQLCLAPIATPVNMEAKELPFLAEGTVSEPEASGAALTLPRYKYRHSACAPGRNAFGVLRVGTHGRRDGAFSALAAVVASGLVASEPTAELGVLDAPPVSVWALGALVAGERFKTDRAARLESLRAVEQQRLKRIGMEREIKAAYPAMAFPEEQSGQQALSEAARRQGEQDLERERLLVEANGDEAAALALAVRAAAPELKAALPAATAAPANGANAARPSRVSAIEVEEGKFKWLDFDPAAYPPAVAAALKQWHEVVSVEDKSKSEFLAACDASYVRFARASEGVPFKDVPALVLDLFVKNAPRDVLKLCMPPRERLPADESRAALVQLVLSAALKRRADAGAVSGAALPFSHVVALCAAVGAISIMLLPSL